MLAKFWRAHLFFGWRASLAAALTKQKIAVRAPCARVRVSNRLAIELMRAN